MWENLKEVRCKKVFIHSDYSYFEVGKVYSIRETLDVKGMFLINNGDAAFTEKNIGEYFEHVNEIRKRKISKLLNS